MDKQGKRIENVSIFELKRLMNSKNGNPRYELRTTHGNFKTSPDASVNYGISNESAWNGGPVTLILNSKGTVDYVEQNGKEV